MTTKTIKIGDKVQVVNCRRSYHENGSTGRIVGEMDGCWLVEFGSDEALMDYMPDELEPVEIES